MELKKLDEFLASGACEACGSQRCDRSAAWVKGCSEYWNFIGEPNPNAMPAVSNITTETEFSQAVEAAKIETIKEASVSNKDFIEKFQDNVIKAAEKLAEVEREKAELEKQNIEYHQELLNSEQLLNEQKQAEDKWINKQRQREFHYAGVRPIMEFVGIKTPMNILLLYSLTLFLLPFFLFAKLWKGTIGALIVGAEDSDRPKAVRGFLYTLLGIVSVGIIALVTYLALGWLNII
ncbi:MAG: hypothetical protein M0R31_06365 [Candidatus Riflebacteria bacterium]|nr:hypothetical protein [Candidatus Riflebacteria bacterium]